jgi:hypothetical protein
MKVKTLVPIEETMTFLTLNPVSFFFIIVNFTASMTHIVTLVLFLVVISFVARCAKVVFSQKGWHGSDHVIVIIVKVQIDLFRRLWTTKNNGIEVFP